MLRDEAKKKCYANQAEPLTSGLRKTQSAAYISFRNLFFWEIIVFSGTSTNCSHHSKTRAKQVVNNRDAPYTGKAKVSIQFGFWFCFWLNNIPYEFLGNWLRDFYRRRRRKTARSILAVDNKCIIF